MLISFLSEAQIKLSSEKIHPIKTIASNDTSFVDLQFLKSLLKNNQILLLGEQSHGDGATFDAKVRLIQFLHTELNYDILAFENGFYDNYKAYQEIKKENADNSPLHQSGFSMWFDSKQLSPLIQYIHKQKESENPLQIAGFDCQESEYFENNFYADLSAALPPTLRLSLDEKAFLRMAFENGVDFFTQSSNDSSKFYLLFPKLKKALETKSDQLESESSSILLQSLTSWEAGIQFELDKFYDRPVVIQNPRDVQMAKNLLFLARKYPTKKIIAWGASYHFAKNLQSVHKTPLTDSLLNKLIVTNGEDNDTLSVDYAEAIPMGKILYDSLGEKMYSLSFSSFDGEFGMLGERPTSLEYVKPPNESLEHALKSQNIPIAWYDFKNISDTNKFYLSALGNIPLLGKWHEPFDGHFFIQTSYPPSYPEIIDTNSTSNQTKLIPANTKIIKDARSKKNIEFARIQKLHSSVGVLSNAQGEFAFDITESSPLDSVIISCIGYRSRFFDYEDFRKLTTIELEPTNHVLQNINIKAKVLTAKQIVEMAATKINVNYFQEAFEQDFFYRSKSMIEDSVQASDIAQVHVLHPQGIQKGKLNSTENKILTRTILGGEASKLITPRLTNNSKLFCYSILTTTRNPLMKTDYYSYSMGGLTSLNNREVYQINFTCTKLSKKATGLGNIPAKSFGTFYIDMENYAILHYEQTTFCSPKLYTVKNDSTIHSHFHTFIQSFQESNGKYYLAYSKNSQIGEVVNHTKNTKIRNYTTTEFMSKEINDPASHNTTSTKTTSLNTDLIFQDDDINEVYKQLHSK